MESQRTKETSSSGARQLRLQSITAQGRPHSFLLFFPFFIHRTSFSPCLFLSHFSFDFPFSFFLSFSHLFFFLFSPPSSFSYPYGSSGGNFPHFPPWPLVITMFFFFIFFFPFITSCNTWLNVSHLFQVYHMALSMCHSLGMPYGIHVIMPCVTRPSVPRKMKNSDCLGIRRNSIV